MNKLSVEDVMNLHKYMVGRYGGSTGMRDIGRLESVVASQSQKVFGLELYVSIPEKAAAMMRGIIQDHPFVDGNKRTGIMSAITLLEWNNLSFKADKQELENFAVRVAVERLEIPEIASWLKTHCD